MMLLHSWLALSAASGWDTAEQPKEQGWCCWLKALRDWQGCWEATAHQGNAAQGLSCAALSLHSGEVCSIPLLSQGWSLCSWRDWALWVQFIVPPVLVMASKLCSAHTNSSLLAAASSLPGWLCAISREGGQGVTGCLLGCTFCSQRLRSQCSFSPELLEWKSFLPSWLESCPVVKACGGTFRADPQIK